MTILTSSIADLFSLTTNDIAMSSLLVGTAVALALGVVIALVFCRGGKTSKGFALTLALLPAIVQMVILLVNGNVGTGVAVMGAFGLVRFRSAPGSAKEICAIFLAMAAGLACGTQNLLFAIIFTLILCAAGMLFTALGFGSSSKGEKTLKLTVPESLDYNSAFDEILAKYTEKYELDEVKTTNMGSLFKLQYTIIMKDNAQEKAMIDELRQRNGNLEISCGRPVSRSSDQL